MLNFADEDARGHPLIGIEGTRITALAPFAPATVVETGAFVGAVGTTLVARGRVSGFVPLSSWRGRHPYSPIHRCYWNNKAHNCPLIAPIPVAVLVAVMSRKAPPPLPPFVGAATMTIESSTHKPHVELALA